MNAGSSAHKRLRIAARIINYASSGGLVGGGAALVARSIYFRDSPLTVLCELAGMAYGLTLSYKIIRRNSKYDSPSPQ